MKTFITACKTLAACAALTIFCSIGHAAVVNVVTTSLGGTSYSASVSVTNDGTPTLLTGFTLFFSETQYSNLVLTGSPGTWDALVIQPDVGIPAAGFLDSFVIDPANALANGQSIAGFNMTFNFLGQGAPSALPFDIVDFNFNVVTSGAANVTRFVPTPGGNVPEPGTLWLLAAGALGIVAARRKPVNPLGNPNQATV